jgi:epoxyqueuosine reductase
MGNDQSSQRNTDLLKERFSNLLRNSGNRGVIGAARFNDIYLNLHPIQQARLREITVHYFKKYMRSGFFVSIGIALSDSVIQDINVSSIHGVDMERWNNYAKEYRRINEVLNSIARTIATENKGIAVPATLAGFTDSVNHVSEYFNQTISHRLVAEMAGLGWRGKNGLIINDQFSCALRFASVVIDLPLITGQRIDSKCGTCKACEDSCSFIRNRTILKDYRENCRRYIISLQKRGLSDEVCGKCIQSCYLFGVVDTQFKH